jgi:hypothetical protein
MIKVRLKKYAIFILVLSSIIFAFIRWNADRDIKILLNSSIKGIENGEAGEATAFISKNYHDRFGYTRSDILEIAHDGFRELKEIHITIIRQSLEKSGNNCKITLDFKAVATVGPERGYIAGSPQQPERVILTLQKEPSGWRIVQIDGLKYL